MITISKRKTFAFISVFLFLLYSFTIGLHEYIYIKGSVGVGISLLLSIVLVVKCSEYSFFDGITPMDLVVFFMIIVVLAFNNADFRLGKYTDSIATIFAFLYYMISKTTKTWHKYCIVVIMFWGIFHSVFTIASLISPVLFKEYMMPLFKDNEYRNSMIKLYDMGYMTGLAPHYSTNSMYLATSVGVPFSLYITKRKKRYLIALMTILFSLLLTGKRGPTLFVVIAFIVTFYIVNLNKGIKPFIKSILIVCIVVLLIVLLSDHIPELLNVYDRVVNSLNSGDIGGGRDRLIMLAFSKFLNNPILGMGWGSFKYLYNGILGLEYSSVHNVFAQLLCEVGVLGSIPFYAFFLISIRHVYYIIKQLVVHEEFGDINHILSYSLYIQLYFLLYCFTGNPLYDPQVLFPYILGCAISEYFYFQYKRSILNRRPSDEYNVQLKKRFARN